jgi:hypothetical protein
MRIVFVAAVFTLGYVLGSRAGRERYAQIMAVTQKATRRLGADNLSGGRPSWPAGTHERDNSAGSA